MRQRLDTETGYVGTTLKVEMMSVDSLCASEAGFFKEMLKLHKPPSLPSTPLPVPSLLPLEVGPLIAARGSGGAL